MAETFAARTHSSHVKFAGKFHYFCGNFNSVDSALNFKLLSAAPLLKSEFNSVLITEKVPFGVSRGFWIQNGNSQKDENSNCYKIDFARKFLAITIIKIFCPLCISLLRKLNLLVIIAFTRKNCARSNKMSLNKFTFPFARSFLKRRQKKNAN